MRLRFDQFKSHVGELLRHKGRFAFRGQADARWPLKTSLQRHCEATGSLSQRDTFFKLLHQFTSCASDFLSQDLSTLTLYQQIALAQHHGIPTPFLDWTISPYIAVFFALWKPVQLELTDSFKVYALNLDEIERMESVVGEVDAVSEANLFSQKCPVRIITTKMFESKRLMRQMGLFALYVQNDDLAKFVAGQSGYNCVHEFEVANCDQHEILRELALMGIQASTLFDTLDGVAIDILNGNR